ncbi:hypothetical protein HYW54_01195 [Candidatus Gottesmanbacteria bacterium]|nr:hypothetical protein [Candidatus Gottesmanbacteria bacterium]
MSLRTQFASLFFATIAIAIAAGFGSALVHNFQTKISKNSTPSITPSTTLSPTITHTWVPSPSPTILVTPSPTVTPILRPLITEIPPTPVDTSPPTTNVFYPQAGGFITFKTDGKICAIMSAPTDDSGFAGVETFYAFDGGSFQKGVGYLCADSLPNGPHTLSFYSKDQAGNTEATRTISFTVNIEGN